MGEIVLVGDRVLVEPLDGEKQTDSGIVLPATVTEKDKVRSGRVCRVGPGYLTANPEYSDEPWRKPHDRVRYLPLQAQPGDVAFFLRKEAIELTYQGEGYLVIGHGAILVLIRPEPKDVLERIQGMLESD